MRIVSNGSFDPLCPSPLVVANAHTMQPRPVLFQQIILGSLDNGQMRCEPCVQATLERPPDEYCFCNCFKVDLPDLCDTSEGGLCADLKAQLAGRTVHMTYLASGAWPSGLSTRFSMFGGVTFPSNCQIRNGELCGWGYEEPPDATTRFPNDPDGDNVHAFHVDYASPEECYFTILMRTGSGGFYQYYFNVQYLCTNFTASGGFFEQTSATINAPIFPGIGSCTGFTTSFPDSVNIIGEFCGTPYVGS